MAMPVADQSLCFMCRFCEHMADAEDRKEKVCGVKDCGGPMKGRLFPKYRGPLEAASMASRCFVCGEPGPINISMPDMSRTLSVCERHVQFANLEIDRTAIAPEDMGVVTTRKVEVPLEEALGLVSPKEESDEGGEEG